MANQHFLHGIIKPENFDAEDLTFILSMFEEAPIARHDYLFELNKRADFYYFIEEGYYRSYTIDTEGNDITTKFFERNDMVIDWRSFFLKTPASESIQALTDGKCWKIRFENFMKLFHMEGFREVGRTRLINHYFDLKAHSISMIADDAKTRYLKLLKERPSIAQNVPLKHMATYLGVTDTSLSRIRKEITL